MNKQIQSKVKTFMVRQLKSDFRTYDDCNCNEVNTTLLAENAANEFDQYLDDNSIPEWIFELSAVVAANHK